MQLFAEPFNHIKYNFNLRLKKLGYSLVFLALVSIVIPAFALNPSLSEEELKIREEILACKAKVDSNQESTVAEKTVAKRECETVIYNKYSVMNNDHKNLAEKKYRLEVIQKCVDWHPSYTLLDEERWRVQKNADQASDCVMIYNDDMWKFSGNDRLDVLAERLLELKAEKPEPKATSIILPSEANQVAQDTRSDKITELEAKLSQLREEIRKKDEIIHEQLNVIMNLANMLKNIVLNSFLPGVYIA